MLTSLAPPLPGGSGTFSVGVWNIRSAWGAGLAAAAKVLRQMGVGCCVLTKTKLTDDRYPKHVSGYHVIASKATSPHQGGVAILWEAEHRDFEVEAVQVRTPNLLTFHLVTGEERYFVMGVYIPPTDTTGVDDLRAAWASCPDTCKPLLLGGLNINLRDPRTEREEIIADFLDDINVIDFSWKFRQRMGRRQGLGARWTWQQRRGGRWYHSQPDYCLARARDIGQFRNVAFRQPRIHDSDHQAVVASISRGRKGRLKKYQRRRQKFSLTLLPVEEQDGVTRAFGELRKTCVEGERRAGKHGDWILSETWHLIKQRPMLQCSGHLCQVGGRRLTRLICASLKQDREARMASVVGSTIKAELTKGNIQEAFRHLKGWYRVATDTQAKP